MKEYQSIYERMDARRRAKMEEVAQMEENLEAKAQEIEDIDEEIAHLERELAETMELRTECQVEYTKLYEEAKRKKILDCISTVIKRAFLISDEKSADIDIESIAQTRKISGILNEYRHIKRRKDMDEAEKQKILDSLNKQLIEETNKFYNLHN